MDKEQEQLPVKEEYVKLPAVKFAENTVKQLTIDFSQPFKKWKDEKTGKTKAIIPCKEAGIDSIFWLNILNPLYRELIARGRAGVNEFKILQTGSAMKTRYILVN